MGHVEQQYLHQPGADWMEGDLSRHKSDSDLQQSLLNQQFPPLVHPRLPTGTLHNPPPSSFTNNKLHATPNDLGVWGKQKRPASISTAASLLSPDTVPHGYQNTLSAPGSGTASSSLPDLTNIEFQSGLDVPLERDDFSPQTTPLLHQSHLPMMSYQAPPTQPGVGFHASNLIRNSFQAPQPTPTSYITSHVYTHQPLLPNVPNVHRTNHPLPFPRPFNHQPQYPYPLVSSNIPALNLTTTYTPQFNSFHTAPPHSLSNGGAIRRSPTAPTFQSMVSGINPGQNRAASAYQPLHPLLPSLVNPASRSNPYQGLRSHLPQGVQSADVNSCGSTLPQMNIVVQPPGPPLPTSTPFSPPHTSLQAQSPLSLIHSPPSPLPLPNDPNHLPGPLAEPQGRNQFSMSSLPATPTITISPGFSALPSYLAAKQQQFLQEKFASFGMHKTEHLVRSHSEENLQVQKEKGDLMHNPFMGNLANANSVPCVYVDSPSNENLAERCDSPVPGDSPSTSASYASSPPSVRPFWIDQQQANDFVFHGHEWPMMDGGGTAGGGGATAATTDRTKPGSPSPLSHHKSLTDLNVPPEFPDLSPRSSRNLQLSLPSIVMGDLAMDEQAEKPGSPVVFNEYNMEDAVMDTLMKQEEISGLHSFDMGFLTSDILLSGSPDNLLQKNSPF